MAKLNVVDNALDFLVSAGDKLVDFERSGSARDIKYALLHLAAGVALLLKQRLLMDHWALAFSDLNKATKSNFDSGDFTSPGLEECLERVSSLCGVKISSVHRNSLVSLRKLRNKIEHFGFDVTREEGLAIGARVWSFTFDFVQDQLTKNMTPDQAKQWESVRTTMLGVQGFVEQRRKETRAVINQKQKGGFTVVDCPLCLETSLHIDDGVHECLFCRYTDKLEEVFDAWMTSFYGPDWTDPKERMISNPVDHCPFCGNFFYVRMPGEGGATPPNPAFVCFSCGFSKSPTVECSDCGREFTPDNWDEFPFICHECEARRQAADR
jgi:Zn finger protein HypA/HybF involved in hydrogenase expression